MCVVCIQIFKTIKTVTVIKCISSFQSFQVVCAVFVVVAVGSLFNVQNEENIAHFFGSPTKLFASYSPKRIMCTWKISPDFINVTNVQAHASKYLKQTFNYLYYFCKWDTQNYSKRLNIFAILALPQDILNIFQIQSSFYTFLQRREFTSNTNVYPKFNRKIFFRAHRLHRPHSWILHWNLTVQTHMCVFCASGKATPYTN